jgi:hypothetical protein
MHERKNENDSAIRVERTSFLVVILMILIFGTGRANPEFAATPNFAKSMVISGQSELAEAP